MHTALCRVKIYDNLYCIWEIKKYMIKVNKTELFVFHNKKNSISDDTVTVLIHNVRSLPRHVGDIVNDKQRHYRIH